MLTCRTVPLDWPENTTPCHKLSARTHSVTFSVADPVVNKHVMNIWVTVRVENVGNSAVGSQSPVYDPHLSPLLLPRPLEILTTTTITTATITRTRTRARTITVITLLNCNSNSSSNNNNNNKNNSKNNNSNNTA